MIAIALDTDLVEAGQFLTGKIHWTGDEVSGATRIIAAAEWRTDGAGNIASGVGRATHFVVRENQRDGVFPFRFLIPHEGPVSFEGELITMAWKLRVRVEGKGFDEFGEAEFRVEVRRGLSKSE